METLQGQKLSYLWFASWKHAESEEHEAAAGVTQSTTRTVRLCVFFCQKRKKKITYGRKKGGQRAREAKFPTAHACIYSTSAPGRTLNVHRAPEPRRDIMHPPEEKTRVWAMKRRAWTTPRQHPARKRAAFRRMISECIRYRYHKQNTRRRDFTKYILKSITHTTFHKNNNNNNDSDIFQFSHPELTPAASEHCCWSQGTSGSRGWGINI